MTTSTRRSPQRQAPPANGVKPAAPRHILDLDDFSRAEIETALQNTAVMREVLQRDIKKVPTLRGKTVITLFYEASTRTRVSFEQAGKILSADVINVSGSGSSVEKGESLYNTALTLQAMNADIIVIRHPHSGAPYFLARFLKSAVINAGDGTHAHPTQALLDLYTINTHFGKIAGLNVVIVGDLLYSRVARSNLWALTKMGANITLCAPPTLIPSDFTHRIANNNAANHAGDNRIDTDNISENNNHHSSNANYSNTNPGNANRSNANHSNANPGNANRSNANPGNTNRAVPINSSSPAKKSSSPTKEHPFGNVRIETNIERALADADVVMALRLQTERQLAGHLPTLREYSRMYGITPSRMLLAKPNALVMHPGPMNEGIEIAPEVAHGAQAAIEEQVTNGVAVRMALLYAATTPPIPDA